MSDEAVLLQVGRGDRGALGDLYDRTVAAVHRLALLLSRGDAAAAQDVVRRTYAEVWRSSVDYRPEEGRAATWVLMVAHQVAAHLAPVLDPRDQPGGHLA